MDENKAMIIVKRLKQLTEDEEIQWVAWSEGKFYYGWDKDNPDGSVVINSDGELVMRGETVDEGYKLLATQDKGGDDLYQVVARKTQAIALRQNLEEEARQACKDVVAQNALLRHLHTLK